MNMIFKMCILVSTIIFSDQMTKALVQQKFYLHESIPIIEGFFHLTYVRNPGAAFGMFGHAADWIRTPLFLWLPVIASLWLMFLVWKARNTHKLQCLSYSLILAGAVGNLIDRFSMNYVVDFLDFFWREHHYPAFNIADSAITIGVSILIFETIFLNKKTADAANPV